MTAIEQVLRKYQTQSIVEDFKGKLYTKDGIAIIGQDPSITTRSEVKGTLMLDDLRSNLYKYISEDILKPLGRKVEDIVAFNLIEEQFSTSVLKIAEKKNINFYRLVDSIAEECYDKFLARLKQYKPKYLITLGKPVFNFIKRKSDAQIGKLKDVFAKVIPINLNGDSYLLIPCVHYNNRNTTHYRSQKYKLSELSL